MKQLFSLLLIIMSGILVASPDENPQSKDAVAWQSKPFINEIQGGWTCVRITEFCKTEALSNYCTVFPVGNVEIRNDSIFLFDYPCQFYFASMLYADSLSLKFNNDITYSDKWTNVSLIKDTLVLHRAHKGGTGHTEYYIRDKFEAGILALLKKDTINLNCLKGQWELITYNATGDGSDAQIVFPFKLPLFLDFTRQSKITAAAKGPHFLNIPVNGTRKRFYIAQLSLTEGKLWLVEGDWWKGAEVPYIRYRLKKIK